MRKLLFSAISLFSLIYPQLLYGDSQNQQQVDLWKIFCAHRLMAQSSAPTGDSGAMVMFEDDQWHALVADLDLRAMPAAFKQTPENLDAWLKCENEYSDSFESAEFLSRGRRYFSLSSVNTVEVSSPVISGVSAALYTRQGKDIYAERWNAFLATLQKAVTTPKGRNTISMRSR